MSGFHFATAWERIADAVPDAIALIDGNVTRTFREYDDRAARLANVLAANGIAAGAKVGIYLHNRNEYIEAQYAAFKLSAMPINVNYRYKADELVYLLDNADAEAIVYQSCYAARIWEIRNRLPRIRCFLEVDDGTETIEVRGRIDFERALRAASPHPRIAHRDGEVYMLYTGGTTGLPKGVMYDMSTFCRAMCAAGFAARGIEPPQTVDELPDKVRALRTQGAPVSLAACPLMHGTGMWVGTMIPLLAGGAVVTTAKLGLDPDLLFELVAAHQVTDIAIVGDAFAKPMLLALDAAKARGEPYDLGSLRRIVSSGVMWSEEAKRGLLAHHDMVLHDAMGSTEGGMGVSITSRASLAETARFTLNPGVRVFDDALHDVAPGSGEIGRLATSGMVPLGYHKDPAKSAATFREVGGVRYSFPGDYARVDADGAITLLGRGSVCINTAGEKVFPEEVEEVLKRHPDIYDCLVVGVPDARFGERVAAVASPHEGREPREDDVIAFARERLAGYKLPKHVLLVDEVRRVANGKADYPWAKRTALERLGSNTAAAD